MFSPSLVTWIDLLRLLHLRKEVPGLNPMHFPDVLPLSEQTLTRKTGSDPGVTGAVGPELPQW